MAITATGNIDGPVDVDFQNTLLRTASPFCPYFYGTVQSEIREHAGTFTAKWRRVENLTPTTTALTPISGAVSLPFRQPTTLSATDITASLSKFGDYVLWNEEVDLKNPTVVTIEFAKTLGKQAGRSLNRLQRNEMEDNATILRAGNVATDSLVADPISVALITRAVNELKNQDVIFFDNMSDGSEIVGSTPIPDALWGITHVDVEEDIRKLPGFRPVETYSSHTPVKKGEFGMVGQVRFCATTESSVETGLGAGAGAQSSVRSTDGATTDIYNTIIYGMEAVGSLGLGTKHIKESYVAGDQLPSIIVNKVEPGGVADPQREGMGAAWKSWHVGKILNGNWIRNLRTAANRVA